MKLKSAFALLCLVLPALASASEDRFNKNYNWEPDVPWEESNVTLPDWPDAADWLPFSVGRLSQNRHFVAAKSIRVGADGTVRYALRVLSPEGAETLTVEGIRCGTSELKRYAVGRPEEKRWVPARNSDWKKLHPGNYAQVELLKEYLCSAGSPVQSPDEAIKWLKRG